MENVHIKVFYQLIHRRNVIAEMSHSEQTLQFTLALPMKQLCTKKLSAQSKGKSAVFFTTVMTTSGVFKGRQARHLPRAPPFWGFPLRCYVHKISLFLVKNVLFNHIMCYKVDRKQVLCFQRAPYRNCNVQVLCFQRGPQQQLQFEGNLLSKGPPTETVMCRYVAFTGALNSNCNLKVICFQRGPQQPMKCVSRPTLLLNFIEVALKKL